MPETPISSTSHKDNPLDISLTIVLENGSNYRLGILADDQRVRHSINLTPNELSNFNSEIHSRLNTCVKKKPGVVPTEEDLKPLADFGHYVFKKVFGDKANTINTLTNHPCCSIAVDSDSFYFPWEIMYPASVEEPISSTNFWGMKHLISRVIERANGFVSPKIIFDNCPKLGLLAYDRLPGFNQSEYLFFDNLGGNENIELVYLCSLDPNNKNEGWKKFKDFWQHRFHIAHFSCHAHYDNNTPSDSYILLFDKFKISIMDMDNYNLAIKDYPLVIMNACNTGHLNSLYTSSFVKNFLQYGARGVIATECAVPDTFAADFSRKFYEYFLEQKRPLGESLLKTRQYFLQEHNNPSGLLYSMYAPPSIQLVKKQEIDHE
jgi:hypothetical protein